jgi:hypothetical protein
MTFWPIKYTFLLPLATTVSTIITKVTVFLGSTDRKGHYDLSYFFLLKYFNIQNIDRYQIHRFENIMSTFFYLFHENFIWKWILSSVEYVMQINVTNTV